MTIAVAASASVLREPAAEEVRARLARGPLVVISAHTTLLSTLVTAGSANGWALLPHDADAHAIEAAVRLVEAGMVVTPRSPGAWTTQGGARPDRAEPAPDAPEPVERLTLREREVLQHVVHGLHNRAIASALGISDHTVKFHLASIFGKLGVSTRTEAVRIGLRRGLVSI